MHFQRLWVDDHAFDVTFDQISICNGGGMLHFVD